MSPLAPFLAEAMRAPHAFGQWDCAMLLANWAERLTGRDPAAELRGRYRTRLGWMRIVKRAGGLDTLVGRIAVAAGVVPAEAPFEDGDIAVILTGVGPAGAIRSGGAWVAKLGEGLHGSARCAAVAAWRFNGGA
jgi:hypothetical protein